MYHSCACLYELRKVLLDECNKELSKFLPPANVVCEGYVFTPVCDSVKGGGGVCGCSGGRVCMVAQGGHVWLLRGACMVAPRGQRAWLLWGGAWLLRGGVCVVAPGGMHGCSGGHAWLLWGVCMVAQGACMVARGGMHGCSGGVCVGYDEIRRYGQ